MGILTYGIKRIIENGTIEEKLDIIDGILTAMGERLYDQKYIEDYDVLYTSNPRCFFNNESQYEFYAYLDIEDITKKPEYMVLVDSDANMVTGKGKDFTSAITDYPNQYYHNEKLFFQMCDGFFNKKEYDKMEKKKIPF